MSIPLTKIAEIAKGELVGDLDATVTTIATHPNDAEPEDLALIFSDVPSQALKLMETSMAKHLVVCKSLLEDEACKQFIDKEEEKNFVLTNRPRFTLKQIIDLLFVEKVRNPELNKLSDIHSSVKLAESVSVGAFTSIAANTNIGENTVIFDRVSIAEDVKIGDNCIIYPGVTIYPGTFIKDRVIIHANSVIGSDGYSYVTEGTSNIEKLQKQDFNFNTGRQIQEKIKSIGGVIIESDVEIGSCSTIDRGTLGNTIIGEGTKIDNLCQIAHNVEIGKDCLIIAKVGIAGSVKISDRVVIAGASGIADGVKIANDVVVGAYSGVHSDLDPYLPVLGIPALPYGEFMNRQKSIMRIPKLLKEFKELREELAEKFKASEG